MPELAQKPSPLFPVHGEEFPGFDVLAQNFPVALAIELFLGDEGLL